MRAGTSKGLFFRLQDLPADRSDWQEVILAAMGSPDATGKQLDGMGGGASTQSKVAVVSPSTDPRADVDYLFIQGECTHDSTDDSADQRWRARLLGQLWQHG
jgi:2-methylaconitate cis-trans-isomerase PrpF